MARRKGRSAAPDRPTERSEGVGGGGAAALTAAM